MNDVDNILLVAKGTLLTGFLFFSCCSRSWHVFQNDLDNSAGSFHTSFLYRSARKAVRKTLNYLDFLMQSVTNIELLNSLPLVHHDNNFDMILNEVNNKL